MYVVFNSFFGLLTQDEQVSSFQAVARHLKTDGIFAMQAFVPDVTRLDVHNQRVAAESVGVHEVRLETSTHDPFAPADGQRPYEDQQRRRPGVSGADPLRVRVGAGSDGPLGR